MLEPDRGTRGPVSGRSIRGCCGSSRRGAVRWARQNSDDEQGAGGGQRSV